MKKTIMGMLFLGTCYATFAQNTQITNTNTTTHQNSMPTDLNSAKNTNTNTNNAVMQSSGNYSAYGPAVNISSSTQMAFTKNYPNASGVTWQQNNEWTKASYRAGARNMNVYYSANGSSYAVALPVVQGYVAEEVIGKALDTYGDRLYSITKLKAADGKDAYQVTLTQNGQSTTEWMREDGTAVTNIYRSEPEDNIQKLSTNPSSTREHGPNAGEVTESEALYYSAMSPDEDYTTNYAAQTTEWTTTAADAATNVNDRKKDDEEEKAIATPNDEAVINDDEE